MTLLNDTAFLKQFAENLAEKSRLSDDPVLRQNIYDICAQSLFEISDAATMARYSGDCFALLPHTKPGLPDKHADPNDPVTLANLTAYQENYRRSVQYLQAFTVFGDLFATRLTVRHGGKPPQDDALERAFFHGMAPYLPRL